MKDLKDLIRPNNMILEEVFLSKFGNEEKPFTLYAVGKTPDETLFCAVSQDAEDEMYFYKYSKLFSEIEAENKEDILNYTLGANSKWEEIYASDIFVHGEFVKEVEFIT